MEILDDIQITVFSTEDDSVEITLKRDNHKAIFINTDSLQAVEILDALYHHIKQQVLLELLRQEKNIKIGEYSR